MSAIRYGSQRPYRRACDFYQLSVGNRLVRTCTCHFFEVVGTHYGRGAR